jgi:hypothetical protein
MTHAAAQIAANATAGDYLTEADVSDLTRFAAGTLRNMRSEGRGPRFLRVGKAIRYRRADVVAWLEGLR